MNTQNNKITMDVLLQLNEQFSIKRVQYKAAIRKMRSYLQILNDEFNAMHQRNPIHHIESRVKDILSIAQKLQRKGFEISMDAAIENLTDIAGVRVVCAYIEDVYRIAELLKQANELKVIRERDYIKNPKDNGYRSLHYIILIPAFIGGEKIKVALELQIRTIAMDFWASLDHRLRYKNHMHHQFPSFAVELKNAANDVANLDNKMQQLYTQMQTLYKNDQVEPKLDIFHTIIDSDEEHDLFYPLNK
ncbi:MAG: GTP pyrophosphokinase family protein [Eubacteriales bacterium]|nr:GTP pyrophosphokinase family protein [Eubacteriales bacterium]